MKKYNNLSLVITKVRHLLLHLSNLWGFFLARNVHQKGLKTLHLSFYSQWSFLKLDIHTLNLYIKLEELKQLNGLMYLFVSERNIIILHTYLWFLLKTKEYSMKYKMCDTDVQYCIQNITTQLFTKNSAMLLSIC